MDYIYLSQASITPGRVVSLDVIGVTAVTMKKSGNINITGADSIRIGKDGIYMVTWNIPCSAPAPAPIPGTNILVGVINVTNGELIGVSAVNSDVAGVGFQMMSGSAIFEAKAGDEIQFKNLSAVDINIGNIPGAPGFPQANGGSTITIHQIAPIFPK